MPRGGGGSSEPIRAGLAVAGIWGHSRKLSESIAPIIVAAFSERRTPRLQRRSDTSPYSFLTAAPKVFGAAKMATPPSSMIMDLRQCYREQEAQTCRYYQCCS